MLLSNDNNIKAYFANLDYIYFIEYPALEKDCDTHLVVLASEIHI